MNDGQLLRCLITMVEDKLLESDEEKKATLVIARAVFDRLFTPLEGLTEEELALVKEGKKLICINSVKKRTGLSLIRSKRLVENYM